MPKELDDEGKPRDRNVRRIHRWKAGTNPHDPDTDNPNVVYTTIGEVLEADEAAKPKPLVWTPGGGPESGMPCPNCGEMTRIVDSREPKEILEHFGFTGVNPSDEKLVLLGCSKCARPVMQMRESALPTPKI